MRRSTFLALVLATGCLTPQTQDKGDDDSSGDSGGSSGGESIYDVRTGAVEADTQVTLNGVVITSGLVADGDGFFIQDPDGGEYSGLFVYLQGVSDYTPYPDDVINVVGTVTDYYGWTELTVASATNIEVVDEMSVTPEVLTGTEGWGEEDWEPWESVLVTLPDQTVTSALDSYGEVDLSAGIPMDNLFFDYSTEYGATYTSITGPLEYFYGFKITPRTEDDLAGYTPGEGPSAASVCDIQMSMGEMDGQPVTLENVVATTGLTTNSGGFWVQEMPGAWCGVYVYLGSAAEGTDFTIAAGDVVTITGSVSEYDATGSGNPLTEISVGTVDDIVASGTTAEPGVTALAAEDVPTTDEAWEAYEGVLISLPDVEITSEETSYGEVETNWGIQLDDNLYYYDLFLGDTFEVVTGVVNYSFDVYELLPRSADDLGGGTGTGGTDPVPMTVSEIQQGMADGTVTDGTSVLVDGAVVTTPLTALGNAFYIQDLHGGSWTGIYVYLGSVTGVTVTPGDVVQITAKVSDYPDPGDLTELVVESASDIVIYDTDEAATPVASTLSSTPADWEPYEGCLLTLLDVTVDGEVDTYGQAATDWGVFLDDQFIDPPVSDGDTFSYITGALYWSFDEWKLEPTEESAYVE